MLSKTLLILAVLCTAILIGCGKTETSENSNANAGNTNKTTTTSTTTTTTTTAPGDKIGIPECDDFITKYEACISGSKVPEAARAQYKSAVEQWRASWKKLAENPATKGTLVAACKSAAEQQAAALKSYGCQF